MKTHQGFQWSTVGAIAVLACQAPAPQFTAQDEATVRGMFDASLKNVRTGDWTAWAAAFSDSAILQPPNNPTVRGRAALEAWGHAFPKIEQIDWPNVQVWGEGTMAYGVSDYVFKLTGGPADSGKQLAVLHKNAAGKWETVAVSFNSSLPPAPPPPARR